MLYLVFGRMQAAFGGTVVVTVLALFVFVRVKTRLLTERHWGADCGDGDLGGWDRYGVC